MHLLRKRRICETEKACYFGDLIYVFFANRKIGDLIYVLTLFFAETQYDGLANTLFFSKKKKKTSADG